MRRSNHSSPFLLPLLSSFLSSSPPPLLLFFLPNHPIPPLFHLALVSKRIRSCAHCYLVLTILRRLRPLPPLSSFQEKKKKKKEKRFNAARRTKQHTQQRQHQPCCRSSAGIPWRQRDAASDDTTSCGNGVWEALRVS